MEEKGKEVCLEESRCGLVQDEGDPPGAESQQATKAIKRRETEEIQEEKLSKTPKKAKEARLSLDGLLCMRRCFPA